MPPPHTPDETVPPRARPERIEVIDLLRGLAAVAVCWFHFTHGNRGFLPAGWLKATGAYGYLGVEVFFVISGFILPYSLARGRFTIGRYHVFVAKRIVRLDPTYVASIGITLFLWWASAHSPGFAGRPPVLDVGSLALHLGYLTGLAGDEWLCPTYWTLAIEFQFYLLLALLFPLVTARHAAVRVGVVAAFGVAAATCPAGAVVFHYLGLFGLGVLTFHRGEGLVGTRAYLLELAGVGTAVWAAQGERIALTGVATALVIAFVEVRVPAPLRALGGLSYCLYLLHVPVGGRVVNLGARVARTPAEQLTVLALALGCSIVAAYLLHRFIERPSLRWAARLRYRPEDSCGYHRQ